MRLVKEFAYLSQKVLTSTAWQLVHQTLKSTALEDAKIEEIFPKVAKSMATSISKGEKILCIYL